MSYLDYDTMLTRAISSHLDVALLLQSMKATIQQSECMSDSEKESVLVDIVSSQRITEEGLNLLEERLEVWNARKAARKAERFA